jgi:hypothetical protein
MVYTKTAAPGVNINTTDLSFGGMPLYTVVSGTSYASPHTAGVIALLENAFPQATVAELEGALTQTAHDLGVSGPDNSYGYGLTNAMAAYQNLLAATGSTPTITSMPVTSATANTTYSYTVVASDTAGNVMTYSLDVAPSGMVIDAASGAISWVPSTTQFGANAVTVRATNTFGKFATQPFSIVVADANDPPVAQNNAYSMIWGSILNVAAPGVLANDSDPDAGDTLTAVSFSAPSDGTLTPNANGDGGFSFMTATTGTKTFTYQARDSSGATSNVATVSITVSANKAPIAVDDTFRAPVNRPTPPYVAQILTVLANDSDPDTAINPSNIIIPATVTITTAPNKGGTVIKNTDGTLSYTPRLNYRGTEVFKYRVRDTQGALSNAATVRVNVW